MDNSQFLVWMHSNKVKHGCVLGKLEGMEKQFRLRKGVSLSETFPSNAEFPLHPDFPNNLVFTDSLMNSEMLLVASLRLRDFFENSGSVGLEYLPVTIKDHKGKLIASEYNIVHPVEPVECLDKDASGAKMSDLLSTNVDQVSRLVIKEDLVPSNKRVFRIAGFPKAILVQRKLAEDLNKTGYTGFRWLELSSYPEL